MQSTKNCPITSLISKSEKALQKLKPNTWQHTMLKSNLKALNCALILMNKQKNNFSPNELRESIISLTSMIKKTKEAQTKFLPGTSQHTLLKNRLKSLQMGLTLIRKFSPNPAPKFSLNYPDTSDILKIVRQTDHKILGRWALACAQRVLPYFEKEFPDDSRPRLALDTLKQWIKTGVFKMSVIRQAALGAHAAARAARPESMARSATRAAGQAVATAHVKTHSLAAANYVLQTIFYAKYHHDVNKWLSKERAWQINKLESLKK